MVNVEKALLLLQKTFASKSKTSLKALKCLPNSFHKYDFVDGGVIFGHALSGNVHLTLHLTLMTKDTKNFGDLVKEMSERVSGFGGLSESRTWYRRHGSASIR